MGRFAHHIFFCEHARSSDSPKGSCAHQGGVELRQYAKERAAQLGLRGRVRVNTAGCLDACAFGPAVVVYPEDVWYRPQNKEDVEEILQEHVLGGRVVERLRIYKPIAAPTLE